MFAYAFADRYLVQGAGWAVASLGFLLITPDN